MKVEQENPLIPLQCIKLQISISTGTLYSTGAAYCSGRRQFLTRVEEMKWKLWIETQIKSGTRESGDSSPHSSDISAAAQLCNKHPPALHVPSLTSAAQKCSVVLHCSGADSSRHSWLVSAQHRCALIHCSALSGRCRASYIFPSNIECLKQRAVMKSVQILHCRM